MVREVKKAWRVKDPNKRPPSKSEATREQEREAARIAQAKRRDAAKKARKSRKRNRR